MYEAHGWFGLAESPHDIDEGARQYFFCCRACLSHFK
jgi:YHS domain-containing protein